MNSDCRDRIFTLFHYNFSIYNRDGEKTEDPRGIAHMIFHYGSDGKLLERKNYNLMGNSVK